MNNLVNPYYKHRNGAVGGEKETDCRMSTTKNNKNEQHKSFGNKGPLNSLSPSFTPFLYSGGQNRKCPSTLTSSGCQHALKNSQGSFITLFRLHKMQLITLNLSCALIWIAVWFHRHQSKRSETAKATARRWILTCPTFSAVTLFLIDYVTSEKCTSFRLKEKKLVCFSL